VRYKIKKYNKADLLDGAEEVLQRCELIQFLSQRIDSIPNTQYIHLSNSIVYIQDYIHKRSLSNIPFENLKLLINNLAIDLDKLNSVGFIHGDINFCNIIFDGTSLKLIDMEPSIFQHKFGKKIFKSGYSFRSSNDLKNNQITSDTDKIGFYFFCDKSISMSYGNLSRYKIADFRRDTSCLRIKEEYLVKMSFVQIFKAMFEKSPNLSGALTECELCPGLDYLQ
jgi:hypothetical protein